MQIQTHSPAENETPDNNSKIPDMNLKSKINSYNTNNKLLTIKPISGEWKQISRKGRKV